MKERIYKPILMSLLVGILFLTSGCKDLLNNPLKDKETGEDVTLLLLDLNFFDTKITFKFEDFDTGDLLVGTDITAFLAGLESDQFVSVFGEKKEEYKTSSGILELYLDPAYTFTDSAIQLDIVAFADPAYISEPTSFEISGPGEKTIVVRMVNWDDAEEELKSALAATITVVKDNTAARISEKLINKTDASGYTTLKQYYYRNSDPYAGRRATYKILFDKYMELYNKWKDKYPTKANKYREKAQKYQDKSNELPAPPVFPDVKLTATSISLDEKTLEYWGFDNNKGKQTTIKGGETAYTAYKQNGLEKCKTGLTIKVTSPDVTSADLTASTSFDYTIDFSDGTQKTGSISGSFKDLAEKGNKIEPIYYLKDSKITVTLKENSQFKFDAPSQSNLDPCGEVTFVAKKKPNLVSYNFNVTYTCPNLPVGLSYSGTGLLSNADSKKQPQNEVFSLTTGGFSCALTKGDSYSVSVLIENVGYSFSINTNDIKGSLSGQSIDGNTVSNVDVSGSDASGYTVNITVSLTDKVCGKIAKM